MLLGGLPMSDYEWVLNPEQTEFLSRWLQGLVGCDCDNGMRRATPPGSARALSDEPCDRCVLVEVGGIMVRVKKDWLTASANVIVPAVEVADE